MKIKHPNYRNKKNIENEKAIVNEIRVLQRGMPGCESSLFLNLLEGLKTRDVLERLTYIEENSYVIDVYIANSLNHDKEKRGLIFPLEIKELIRAYHATPPPVEDEGTMCDLLRAIRKIEGNRELKSCAVKEVCKFSCKYGRPFLFSLYRGWLLEEIVDEEMMEEVVEEVDYEDFFYTFKGRSLLKKIVPLIERYPTMTFKEIIKPLVNYCSLIPDEIIYLLKEQGKAFRNEVIKELLNEIYQDSEECGALKGSIGILRIIEAQKIEKLFGNEFSRNREKRERRIENSLFKLLHTETLSADMPSFLPVVLILLKKGHRIDNEVLGKVPVEDIKKELLSVKWTYWGGFSGTSHCISLEPIKKILRVQGAKGLKAFHQYYAGLYNMETSSPAKYWRTLNALIDGERGLLSFFYEKEMYEQYLLLSKKSSWNMGEVFSLRITSLR